jgi:hypothetical protein
MDLDNDYYSSRCKARKDLRVIEGTFVTLVGGDIDHQTVFYYSRLKELFASVGWGGDALTLQNLSKLHSKIPLPRGGERNCAVCKLPSNYISKPLQGCYQSEWVLEIAPNLFEYQAGYQS